MASSLALGAVVAFAVGAAGGSLLARMLWGAPFPPRRQFVRATLGPAALTAGACLLVAWGVAQVG